MLRVEVVYALQQAQKVLAVELASPASALQAVQMSGILRRHPELDAGNLLLGIAGKKITPHQALKDRDRVEILRPLAADPKEARRRRARRR